MMMIMMMIRQNLINFFYNINSFNFKSFSSVFSSSFYTSNNAIVPGEISNSKNPLTGFIVSEEGVPLGVPSVEPSNVKPPNESPFDEKNPLLGIYRLTFPAQEDVAIDDIFTCAVVVESISLCITVTRYFPLTSFTHHAFTRGFEEYTCDETNPALFEIADVKIHMP